MEKVKAAQTELSNALSRKHCRADYINDSLSKMSMIETVLNLNSVSIATFNKLVEVLRIGLQQLYAKSLQLTLRLALSVFQMIYDTKICVPAGSRSAGSKAEWEMAQTAILAGILDYLESHPTHPTKSIVGNVFHEHLCRIYFSSSKDDRVSSGADLLTSVYMLISDTIQGMPDKIENFRKAVGQSGLGYTLWNTREFLPLEALLELFANMLPPKTRKAKRSQFIRDVFDPAIFPCSAKVDTLVQSAKSWDDTSAQIIDCLAASQLTFPQPFDTALLMVGSKEEKKIDRIYVDELYFLTSIDEDDKLNTLTILYTDVKEITLSIVSNNMHLVNLALTGPPMIGKDTMKVDGGSVANWKIRSSDVDRFVSSLRERNLSVAWPKQGGLEHGMSRKLSVAAAQIDFGTAKNSDSPLRSTQEKVTTITKLWDRSTPAAAVFSSPPIGSIFPPASDEVKSDSLLKKAPEAIYIDDNGNLTMDPTKKATERKHLPKPSAVVPQNEVQIKLSQDSMEISQPVKAGRRCTLIVLSDDDDDDDDAPSVPIPLASPEPKAQGNYSRVATPAYELKTGLSKKQASISPTVKTLFEEKGAGGLNDLDVLEESPCKVKKRKAEPVQEATPAPESPVKRPRLSTPASARAEPAGRDTRSSRAGKQKPVTKVPDVPAASSNATKERKRTTVRDRVRPIPPAQTVTKKAAMKDRAGQKVPTKPTVTAKAAAKVLAKGEADKKLKLDALERKLPPERNNDSSTLPRPSTTTNLTNKSTTMELTNPTASPKIDGRPRPKRKKAPWERDSFLTKIEKEPSPFNFPDPLLDLDSGGPLSSQAPPISSADSQMEGQQEQDGSDTFIAEYTVPTKQPPSSSSVEEFDSNPNDSGKVLNDVTMVDLPVELPILKKPADVIKPRRVSDMGIQTSPETVTAAVKITATPNRPLAHQEQDKRAIVTRPKWTSPAQQADNQVSINAKTRLDLPTRHHSVDSPLVRTDSDKAVPELRAEINRTKGDMKPRDGERETRAVIEALNRLNDELIRVVTSKFDGTSQTARRIRQMVLRAAAEGLESMRLESAQSFNTMVDLETDYASQRKKMTNEIEAFLKSGHLALDSVKDSMKHHSKNTLSRKFPTTLFSKPFPFKH